jgi:hypothetical protein
VICDAVDAGLIEAPDPKLETTDRYPGMSEGEFDASATKQQQYSVEPFLSLLIGTAANSYPQLLDGAVFGIRVIALATDA